MIYLYLLAYGLCEIPKGTLNPQAFFWGTVVQACLVFLATLPVLLWLSDSIRARRLRAEVFNALPFLDRVAGVTIPLWVMWWWFNSRAKAPSYTFLKPYIPRRRRYLSRQPSLFLHSFSPLKSLHIFKSEGSKGRNSPYPHRQSTGIRRSWGNS
jgi:hypothetical protein